MAASAERRARRTGNGRPGGSPGAGARESAGERAGDVPDAAARRAGGQRIEDDSRGAARRIAEERVRAHRMLAGMAREVQERAGPVALAYLILAHIQLAALERALRKPSPAPQLPASITPLRKLWIAWRNRAPRRLNALPWDTSGQRPGDRRAMSGASLRNVPHNASKHPGLETPWPRNTPALKHPGLETPRPRNTLHEPAETHDDHLDPRRLPPRTRCLRGPHGARHRRRRRTRPRRRDRRRTMWGRGRIARADGAQDGGDPRPDRRGRRPAARPLPDGPLRARVPGTTRSWPGRIGQAYGRLHGIVHAAAAFSGLAPLAHLEPAEWLRTVHVNLNAPFLVTAACLPLLQSVPGRDGGVRRRRRRPMRSCVLGRLCGVEVRCRRSGPGPRRGGRGRRHAAGRLQSTRDRCAPRCGAGPSPRSRRRACPNPPRSPGESSMPWTPPPRSPTARSAGVSIPSPTA